MNILVIGATGDVGRGVVQVLRDRGHAVAAMARNAERLAALAAETGAIAVAGSLADDASAARAAADVRAVLPTLDGVVVSINAPRERSALMDLSAADLADALNTDLVAHFTAARAFIPAITDGGVYIGVAGGSSDYILAGGAHMSVAQAGLRMLHRALAHEVQRVHVRQLTVASVVSAASNRHAAQPAWVTDLDVGEQAAQMLEQPDAFADPVWRMGFRGRDGKPRFASEGPSNVAALPLNTADLPTPAR